jgi:hypothetical protein
VEEVEAKICTGCGEEKPLDQFFRHSTGRLGRQAKCKVCSYAGHRAYVAKDPAKRATQQKAARDRRAARGGLQEYERANNLRYLYGLTPEQVDQMVAQQNGLCALCFKPPVGKRHFGRLHIDHDHQTGKVRRLLCGRCNMGLGYFDDDLERLRLAVAYLEAHQ